MKKLIYILLILSSCAIPDDNSGVEKIPDQEIFEQAYLPYWKKQDRPNYIFHKYAVLEDTFAIKKMAYYLKYGKGNIPFTSYNDPINFPYFEGKVNSNYFIDFQIIDKTKIATLLTDTANSRLSFYVVSKPYRVDTTNIYVIQEFRLPYNLGCVNARRTELFFEYEDGEFKALTY